MAVIVGDTFVNPDQFLGANLMEKCNNMASQAPRGSRAYLPPNQIYSRTPGTNYGILDIGRITEWFSDASEQQPLWYDASFAGVADVFKSVPTAGSTNRRFTNLSWSPDNGAIPWNKNAPQCNYARRVMSFEYGAGIGEGKMIMEGCYAPYGTDAAIVFEGLDGNASLYSSIIRGCRTDGGMAFRGLGGQPGGIGDSVTILDHRADGKFGIDMSIMAGAGEVVIAGLQGATYGGPMLKVRRGNKLRVTGLNGEQQNWDAQLFPGPKRVIDISMENAWVPVPGQPPSMLNGLELEGTVSAHSGQPFDNVVYIDRALLPNLSRLNLYSPSAVTTTMLEFGPNCLNPMMTHPPTFGGQFTNTIICPDSTQPLGWPVSPTAWDTPFQLPYNQTGRNFIMVRNPQTGTVSFAGNFKTDGTVALSSGAGVFAIPAGFGAKSETAIKIKHDAGECFLIVSAANAAGNGWASLEGNLTGASVFRGSGEWISKDHIDGIRTNN